MVLDRLWNHSIAETKIISCTTLSKAYIKWLRKNIQQAAVQKCQRGGQKRMARLVLTDITLYSLLQTHITTSYNHVKQNAQHTEH